VLRLLKTTYPASEVYWWLESSLVPLLEGDPDLAGIIPFHRKRWSKVIHWPEAWSSLQEIRRHRFDWVVDLQSLLRSGIVAWLANGEFTIGLDDPREGARAFYDVTVPRPSYSTHAVDWYKSVLQWLNVPVHSDFDWIPERPSVRHQIQKKWDPGSYDWVALQPGARWVNKRWPAEYYAELVRMSVKRFENARFVILGSPADTELGRAVAAIAPSRCLNLAGASSLPEMVEWVRLSKCMVTNDTGPMHVAAALKKPIIALFGPTEPMRTGPYGCLENVQRVQLPCVPCMKSTCAWPEPLACLREISPSRVFSVLEQHLAIGTG
jgi:lipopolysaccharide heptosyltransferase II